MNCTDFFYQEGKTEKKEIPFPLEEVQGYKVLNSPMLTLVLTNQGKGKAGIEGKAVLEFEFSCDRCLKEVKEIITLDFFRTIYAPEAITDEEIREEQYFVNEYELDLLALLEEELQLSWPMKVLCQEDCKGMCKKCGHNLNEGDCGCDDFVPDIRFANLMDIFNGNNGK